MAEALLRHHGGDRFEVYSAGTEPQGRQPADAARPGRGRASTPRSPRRSRSREFLGQPFDYVVTVCDQARQVCPVFPGVHESLHWGYEDPAAAEGTEEERLAVFRRGLHPDRRARPAVRGPDPAATGLMRLSASCATPTRAIPRPGSGRTRARPLSDKGRSPGRASRSVPGRQRLRDRPPAQLAQAAGTRDRGDRGGADRRRRWSRTSAGRRDRPRPPRGDPARPRADPSDPCSSATTPTSATSWRTCQGAPSPMRKGALARIDVDGRWSLAAGPCAG